MNSMQSAAVSLGGLDWLLIALLVYSTVRAFIKGLVLEVFSIVGMASGIVLASWNYPAVAFRIVEWTRPFADISLTVANIAAFLSIVLGAAVTAGVAGRIIRRSASAIGLGLVDRLCGALFGLARGSLLGVAVTLALTAFDPASRLVENSRLFPYFLAAAHGVSFVVPASLQHRLSDGSAHIKHTTPAWINPPE